MSYFLFFENIFLRNKKLNHFLNLKREYLFLRENTLGKGGEFFLKKDTHFSLLDASFSKRYYYFLKEIKEDLDKKGRGEFVKSVVSRKPLFYGLKDFIMRVDLGYKSINDLVLRVLFFEYNIIFIYSFYKIYQNVICYIF